MQNVLVERRLRKQLAIPSGIATLIAKNNKLLKPIALYLELKPLFHTGIILARKQKKSLLYKDIAEYTGLSQRSIQQKISALLKLKLAKFDKNNNLHLAAYKKLCSKFKLSYKFKHKVKNQFLADVLATKNILSTEYILKTLAIKENLHLQNLKLNQKLFAHEIKDTELVKQSYPHYSEVNPEKAKDRYFKWVAMQLQNQNKPFLRLYKKIMQFPERYLAKHYQKMLQDKINGETHFSINPELTLSCNGIANLYQLKSKSAGHYWQQKLKEKGLLNITNERINYCPEQCYLVYLQKTEGDKGVFHFGRLKKSTLKTEKKYFFMMPNLLQPTI